MELQHRDVELQVGEQRAQAWTARPARVRGPLPGIVLIQEAFGVDAHIADVGTRLAAAGYAVIAPHLFSLGRTPDALHADRIEAGKRFLDAHPMPVWFDPAMREAAVAAEPAETQAALRETLAALLPATRPWDAYLATLQAGRAWLEAEGAGRIGTVGFCLGGLLALRLACVDPAIHAAVVYYGFPPPLELVPGLAAPVLAFYASEDPRINAAVPALVEAMAAGGKRFAHHTYANTRHAFFNDTRATYDVAAARAAWARTLAFFAAELA